MKTEKPIMCVLYRKKNQKKYFEDNLDDNQKCFKKIIKNF